MEPLTLNEILMVILTFIIAVSVGLQAKFMRDQAKITQDQAKITRGQANLAKEAEARQRQKEEPKIKITTSYYSDLEDEDEWGKRKRVNYLGFAITNASPFDVTIAFAWLELGIKEDDDYAISRKIDIPPLTKYKKQEISDSTLPHRLQYGETITILYKETNILRLLTKAGGGQPARVRPQCSDSLGNTYSLDYWVMWNVESVAAYNEPGPGYRTSQE